LPKGIDLSNLSQTYLNDIARLLNRRPRQTLGRLSPEQALAQELENVKLAKSVALDY
jgi:IS30 family transposase